MVTADKPFGLATPVDDVSKTLRLVITVEIRNSKWWVAILLDLDGELDGFLLLLYITYTETPWGTGTNIARPLSSWFRWKSRLFWSIGAYNKGLCRSNIGYTYVLLKASSIVTWPIDKLFKSLPPACLVSSPRLSISLIERCGKSARPQLWEILLAVVLYCSSSCFVRLD